MILSTEQLTQLKQLQLEMLTIFIQICQQLNLKYYLLGGTLLGAVRHKGFIPWDDDIDVGMPRHDYEIFVQKGQALLPSHLFLQNIHSDPNFPSNFSKIRNNNTTYIESTVKNIHMHHGVFIDVFPLDHYPDGKLAVQMFKLKNKLLQLIVSTLFFYPGYKGSLKVKIVYLAVRVFHLSPQKAVHRREQLLQSFPSGSRTANYCGAWGAKEIVPTDWYADGTNLQFEGLTVRGPSGYDQWLTQVYGNYMQLPPVEKRVGHHYAEVVDLHTPYTAYIRESGS